jgi:peptidoglycan/LPS O-acetylase OafA/YrhL
MNYVREKSSRTIDRPIRSYQKLWHSDGRSRENNLDFLRLVFATAVIYTHSYDLLKTPGEKVLALTGGRLSASGFAVCGFFVISGFLVSQSWYRCHGFFDFINRRLRRIVPGFVTCVLLCFCLLGPLGAESLAIYFSDASAWRFLSLLVGKGPQGVDSVFATNPTPHNINGSLWTIRIEFFCYLLVAAFGVARSLDRSWLISIFTITAFLLGYCIPSSVDLPLVAHQLLSMLPSFASGVFLFTFRESIPRSFGVAVICFGLMLVPFNPLTVAAWSYITMFLGTSKPLFGALIKQGDYSYGMYLYAFPIQQLWIRYWPSENHPMPLLLTVVSIVTTLPFAVLSWHLVESKWLSRNQKKTVSAVC